MKVRIDEQGNLWFERGTRKKQWKAQTCPFDSNPIPCGDWCPLFQEPQLVTSEVEGDGKYWVLHLCKAWYAISPEDFEDLRGEEEKEKD